MKNFKTILSLKMQTLFIKDDIASISACASEYKLLPWIDKKKLVVGNLFENPNSIHMLGGVFEEAEKDPFSIYFDLIKENHSELATQIIEKRLKLETEEGNIEEIKNLWEYIFPNPNAIHIMKENFDDMYIHEEFDKILYNPNGDSILIFENYTKTNSSFFLWDRIMTNPNCIDLIEKQLEKTGLTNGCLYCLFRNPNAGHITNITIEKLEVLVDSNYVNAVLTNPNEIKLIKQILEENKLHIYWECLSQNPSIFELEKRNEGIHESLKNL
jgi:hypothetical protein